MSDEKFDELFDEAFERAVKTMSPVDPESRRASWTRLQNQRQQQSSRRRRKRTIRMTSVAAGLILFGSVAFSEPVRTGALTPLYQKLYSWSTGEVVVVNGEQKPLPTEGALTPPPPEGVEKPVVSSTSDNQEVTAPAPEPGQIISSVHYTEEVVSLDEVRQRLAYPMPEFSRVPADMKLNETTLSVPDDGSAPVSFTLRYKGEGGRVMSVFVDTLIEGSNRTYSFGIGKMTAVQLDNGLEGQFVDREGDSEDIVHVVRGRIDIIISGNLERDELLQMAGHIVDGAPR